MKSTALHPLFLFALPALLGLAACCGTSSPPSAKGPVPPGTPTPEYEAARAYDPTSAPPAAGPNPTPTPGAAADPKGPPTAPVPPPAPPPTN